METADTRARACDLYRALAARDRNLLWTVLAEDIDWLAYTPAHIFAFSGRRHGREAVVDAIRQFTRDYEMERYRQEVLIVEGLRAAAIVDLAFVQRATQRKLRVTLADFMRFENSRLVEFRQFMNSFDLVEQALGREINLDSALAP